MPRGPEEPRNRSRAWSAALIVAALVFGFFHLREIDSLPRELPPSWSHDARHLRLAESLRAGEGLGAYSADTLRDRPGYAIFLARAADLGLGERRLSALLRLAACLVCAILLLRLRVHPLLVIGAFSLALLSPTVLGEIGQRLAPEKLHALLAALVTGGLLHALVAERVRTRLLVLALVGLPLALDLITSSAWRRLLPLLFLALVVRHFLDVRGGATGRVAVLRLALALVLVSLPALVTVARIESVNAERYGLDLLSDEDESDYQLALGALQRVARATQEGRLDPVTRARLYELSPTLARMRDVIESDLFSGPGGREDRSGRPAALLRRTIREGARRAGAYESAASARDFYRRLAGELNRAVDGGEVAGLAAPLANDRPELPFSAVGLLWLRLGELWSLQFEDLWPGDALPRIELEEAELRRAEDLLGEFPRADARFEARALRREGRLILYRRILPGLFVLAAIGLIMRLADLRRRGLDKAFVVELVLVAGMLAYLLALCAEEAGWLIDQGRGYLPLHLVAPFWLALAIAHHVREVAPLLDRSGRRSATLVLALLLVFGLVLILVLPQRAAERSARGMLDDADDFLALREPGSPEPPKGAFVLRDAEDAIVLRLRRGAAHHGRHLMVFEAELAEADRATPFEIEWEGPARDERGGRKRQLFVKEARGRNRWEIAIETRPPGDFRISAPESPGLVIRPLTLRFEELERSFAPGPDTLPELRAYRTTPDRLRLEIRGGERESRYEFFFSGGVSSEPRIYPERSGELRLEDALGLHDREGRDLRLELLTDREGNGTLEARLEAREDLPEALWTQGLGTQHFTPRPVECEKLY